MDNGQWKVFPNPSNGKFNIESSVVSGQLSVEVYNMLGEKVYSTTSVNGSSQVLPNRKDLGWAIDLTGKPAGMYFYRIMAESGNKLIAEGKLIVE